MTMMDYLYIHFEMAWIKQITTKPEILKERR
jgi:hypothetical protein